MAITLHEAWHRHWKDSEKMTKKCHEMEEKTRVTKKYKDADGFQIICSQYTMFRAIGQEIESYGKCYEIELLDADGIRIDADRFENNVEAANEKFKEFVMAIKMG